MTPYNLAESLLKSGVSFDAVVAAVAATGLEVADARVATRAAQATIVSPLGGRVAVADLKPAPARIIVPGFQGWLLVATVVLGVWAAIGVVGQVMLAPSAVAMLRLNPAFILLANWRDPLSLVLVVTGLVMLLRRRKTARVLLIAWALFGAVDRVPAALGAPLEAVGIAVSLLWVVYFFRSRQLRATLDR